MHKEEYYEMISFYLKQHRLLLYDHLGLLERSLHTSLVLAYVHLNGARRDVVVLRAVTEASVAIHRSLVHTSSFLSLNVCGTRYSRLSYRG